MTTLAPTRSAPLVAALGAATVALGAACDGEHGTNRVSLVTAPGSTVLEGVVHARLTLTDPLTVVEAARGEPLVLEADADGQAAEVWFEGLDAAGARVAVGRTASLPIAAIDTDVRIYVAPPNSIAASPAFLAPARTDIGTGTLRYGVLLAGGADAAGAPIDRVTIYNVYTHTLQDGAPLPAPRAGLVVGMGVTGYAYLFGGRDATGATGSLWRFDTNVAPAGQYTQTTGAATLARAGTAIAPIARDRFLLAGTPPVLLEGISLAVQAVPSPASLLGTAAVVTNPDAVQDFAVFVGEGAGSTGVTLFDGSDFSERPAPGDALRTGHASITVGDQVVVLGGARSGGDLVTTALRITPAVPAADTRIEVRSDPIATPRRAAAVALSGERLLVVGGADAAGAVLSDAELIDAATLTPIASIPLLVPRTGAIAQPLANGQILVAGGLDANGAPTSVLELFTPDLPDS